MISTTQIWFTDQMKMRWAGQMALMGEEINAHRVLVDTLEEKDNLVDLNVDGE